MKRAAGLVLLLALAAPGQERALVSFRLARDPGSTVRGWVVGYTQEGLRYERFGGSRMTFLPWDDLVEEDRRSLRRRFKLEGGDAEAPGLVDGHRIRFEGGFVVDGVLDRVDGKGRHWVRSRGLLLPYPGDRIAGVEPRKVEETEVYDEEELYLRRLQRVAPSNAREHRDVADYAFRIGDFEDARVHYEKAVRLHPAWRATLADRLREIDDLMEDERVARLIGRVRRKARLDRDFEAALELLEELRKTHPDRSRFAVRLSDEIEEDRTDWLRRRFHRVKSEEFQRAVERFLARETPTLEEAMRWATSELEETLRRRILSRLDIRAEELDAFFEARSRGSPHWATYGSGSFILSNRAVTGTPSPTEIRGDPDGWWRGGLDDNTRERFLRAYAAERLPRLFEVIQVKTAPCGRCGGTGRIRHVSLRGLEAKDGGHEFFQRCPRCFGARVDRAVGYR